MSLSPELAAAYAMSARPYLEAEGPVPAPALGMKSWRYLIEINSACNLRCALCTVGNREGYEFNQGNALMDMDLLEKVLDKIQTENPAAIVCAYANGEPMLHPQLPECVSAIKRRGFRCEVSSNLNHVHRLTDFFAAGPDLFIISMSGFTQEVYEKHHVGGDVERVKANLHRLKDAHNRTGGSAQVAVSYHMYEDNLHELELVKEFIKPFGFQMLLSWARTITLEPTIQALRELDRKAGVDVPPYGITKDGLDLNKLPSVKDEFFRSMEQLRFPPAKARALYARFPVSSVCLIGDVFTYIRHNGAVNLCAWCDDLRLSLGNYLEMTQEQISEARRGHPLCVECLRYRMNLYYHVADCNKWDGMNNVS